MAAPTQQLPPWLSPSVVVADGQTATSLVYLPLTYYGPSIPLGSLFTFGGSTSPASTSTSTTPTATSTSASITSSATPSSSTATPPTSSTSSFASSTSASSSSTSSPTSSSSTSSVPSASATSSSQNHGLARGQLIGVIIASILGFIFLFVLALFLYLWWSARRRRQARDSNAFAAVPLDDEEYVVVGTPGEGSPRASGEEADPFLRREHGMADVQGPVAPVSIPAARRHIPSADNSLSSNSASTNSAASGYGTLLANPSLGVFPPFGDESYNRTKGKILSPEQLRQFDHPPGMRPRSRLSTVGEQGELTALTPPPRLVDPSHSHSRSLDRMPSLNSQVSSDAGEATLLTATRVRAEDLGPRAIADSSHKRDSLRGFGLAALGWFQGLGSSSSRRNSQVSPTLQTTRLGDRDIEAGRALLSADTGAPAEMSEVPHFRGQLGLGVGYGGDRPISGASANSRSSTIYHDAQSSLPGTPLVMPPPRALANSSSAELGYWPPSATDASSSTAAQAFSHDSRTGTIRTQSTSATVDILDMPVPRAVSPFASANSVRDKSTTISSDSSLGKTDLGYPPGLSIPAVWNETTGTTPSPGSFAAAPPEETEISIDILEEEPPLPGNHWKSLATGHTARRTTFGNPQISDPIGFDSEQGSLHSMRSYLSPTTRSTGSAAASRREQSGSTGSASSRPSARSAARSLAFSSSDGSGASLSHSGSISSSDRRKNRARTMSPTLSAFGSRSPPPSTSGHTRYPSSLAGDESPLKVAIPSPIAEGPAVGSSLEEPRRPSPHSPRSPLASVPWAAGLDDAWSPS